MRLDLIAAVRGLRRTPVFALAAILTLALGIGANTTMFSVVNAVLLRPLPGYDTGRLVEICDTGREGCRYLGPSVFLRLRERLQSFTAISAKQNCRMNLTGRGEPEQLNGPCTTANWFQLQHAQAMLGRTFLPDEDRHGRNHVVVLDHGYWQRRFGGDPKTVGSKLILDGAPWLVIGVMPPEFRPLGEVPSPIYTPYVVEDNPHGLYVAARLKPGVSLAAARAELEAACAQIAREDPEWKWLRLAATPVIERMTGEQRPLLLLLFGAVSLVLLIACVNVANLLLARSAARRHEIDIRVALGATRGDILRFVLAEAAIVSALSTVAALVVAYGGLHALAPLTERLPRAEELSIDGRVLLCALVLGAVASLCFGMLPALRSAGPPRRARAPQRALVAAEVALAFVLLFGAGLLIRSFAAMQAVDLGYDARNVLTNFLALPESPDGSRDAGVALYARLRERIAALPGASGVATASSLPMFGVGISMDVHPEGEPERKHEHVASLSAISDDYFRVMRIPLREGRAFARESRAVAVVSESVSRRYFGGRAIGRRILVPEVKFNVDGGADVATEIVGVAGNVCVNSVADCEAEHIYLPESRNAMRMANLLVRSEGSPLALVGVVRQAMRTEGPSVPLDEPETLEHRTGYLTDDSRRAMWLLGVFAALALVLAATGVYGVSAYLAAQRSREIGIRMALGARFADIAALIGRSTLVPAAAGLGVGVAISLWSARLLDALLFGVTRADARTLVASAVTLLGVAALAAAGPAVRAGLTDPAKALRRE